MTVKGVNALPSEILKGIFDALPFEDCMGCAQVSTTWGSIVEKTLKEKLIPYFKETIEQKGTNFSKMTSQKLETFCPNYLDKLKKIEEELHSLSAKEIYQKLNNITEKYHVHIATNSQFDLSLVDKAIVGNQFVKLNYRVSLPQHVNADGDIFPWGEFPGMQIPEVKCYFPLKLFDENAKRICLPLKGRLIELIREPNLDQNKQSQLYFPETIYIPQKDAHPEQPLRPWKRKYLNRLIKEGFVPANVMLYP
jgi:hypothetical protein